MEDLIKVKSKPFSVVTFSGNEENLDVEAVPTKWITEGKCPWPEKSFKGFRKLLKDKDSAPEPTWPLFEVEINDTSGTYDRAVIKVNRILGGKEALETTDCDTTSRVRTKKAVSTNLPAEPSTQVHINESHSNVIKDPSLVCLTVNDSTNVIQSSQAGSSSPQNIETNEPAGGVSFVIDSVLATKTDIAALQEEFRKFQEEVLKEVGGLKEDIRDLKQLLQRVLSSQSLRPTAANSTKILDFLGTKIATAEEFNTLEGQLSSSPEAVLELTSFLSRIGGETITQNVNNVLATLFKIKAAAEVGLTTGKTGKCAVKGTQLCRAICDAVFNTPHTERVTDDAVIKDIGKWFRSKAYTSKHNEEAQDTAANEEEEN